MRNSSFMGRFQDWLSDWSEGKTRISLVLVLAVLMGLLLGMVGYTIIKQIFYDLFPRPPIIDYHDPVQAAELLKTDPVGAYWVIAVSWFLGTIAGAYVAARVAKMGQFAGWLAGVLLAAFYLCDLFFQPNTLLIFVLCPVLVGLAAWAGSWLGMYVNVRKQIRAEQRSAPVIVPEVSDTVVE
ncbi:hypothetical protein [Asticcacaulis solisilvae]|uniref:hypothetical protein n=1 Tax=Asticcacaulis solisilvae TaxID=1217274 RepID=UPI003FD75427